MLYLLFLMMLKFLMSFDGIVVLFFKLIFVSNIYLGFNDVVFLSVCLFIIDDGIIVSGVIKEEFDNFDEIEYNVCYDFLIGSYLILLSMNFYIIFSGIYD